MYIQLLTEELVRDPDSPTRITRRIVGADKCAVFDMQVFDEAISSARKCLRRMERLRRQAESHDTLVAESAIKELGIPYRVVPFKRKTV